MTRAIASIDAIGSMSTPRLAAKNNSMDRCAAAGNILSSE
jgi:hypothetical protein